MPPLPLSPHAQRLESQLSAADQWTPSGGPSYHVASLGSGFYFAYEQLRNVAEYREHHLLLRGAIERYLVRYVRYDHLEPVAGDMVTELTQAGYLKNDSVGLHVVDQIDQLLESQAQIYTKLKLHRVDGNQAAGWLDQITSVQIESLISPDPKGNVFMQFAFEHYFYAVDRPATLKKEISDHDYRIALFCAVQRAIFKSDVATTRANCVMLSLPNLPEQPAQSIFELNKLIDELYQAPVTNKLARIINRYGAPIRILRELVIETPQIGALLVRRGETLGRSKDITAAEYIRIQKSLSSRIIRTIVFIFMTKTLIGVSIEVPYDIFVHGGVQWPQLIANILFPVIYMGFIASRISTPGTQNT
jgi:hypothetical protein